MKQRYQNYGQSVTIICFSFFLFSCNAYFFSQPQPVDRKNIYSFPSFFRGSWVADGDSSVYQIGKKNITIINHSTEKIVKGAWPQIHDKADTLHLPPHYASFQTILYDSLKGPVDTTNNYLVRDEFIYELSSNGHLKKGYSYQILEDTFLVQKNDTSYIDLGQNAFLRQINKQFYVLNLSNAILGDEEEGWWMIMLLEKINSHSFNTWEFASSAAKLPCMIYSRNTKADVYYFNCSWTSRELERKIQEDYFDISSRLRKQ
jgi:hypothetical protein